jgi:hypothetical protein
LLVALQRDLEKETVVLEALLVVEMAEMVVLVEEEQFVVKMTLE